MGITETTIAIQFLTREQFKLICKREGRTYDGMLRHWISMDKIKQNKKKKKRKYNGK